MSTGTASIPAAEVARDPAVLESIIDGIHSAGNPYFDYIFGAPDVSRHALGAWVHRSSSELALQRVTLLMEERAVVGGLIGLNESDWKRCRTADTIALVAGARNGRAELAARLESTKGLFHTPAKDDFYLSKIWVAPPYRGCGYGRRLIEKFLAMGEQLPARRFCLDVCATNAAAIRLYERYGFTRQALRESASGLAFVPMFKDVT